ncbi:MAG: RNA ligase family protein [Kiloniellales bacterium]|nr:RNA ligase family protein [Kiloniellales bacterium]
MEFVKFPRTRHIQGSRHQAGDLSEEMLFSDLAGATIFVSEKVDGANCGISFGRDGRLQLQSRGQYLSGGSRERHFDALKAWVHAHSDRLRAALEDRYVMFGEWLYAKHTVYYDLLPHYFLEFDVFDRVRGLFLSTQARRRLLGGLPIISAPLLHVGYVASLEDLDRLIGHSRFKSSDWREALVEDALASGNSLDHVKKQTDPSDLAEGLYMKIENGDTVEERFKFVRSGFRQAIESSEGHWLDRPILPNRLVENADVFAATLGVQGAYDAM